jgi:hypothetical protein
MITLKNVKKNKSKLYQKAANQFLPTRVVFDTEAMSKAKQ